MKKDRKKLIIISAVITVILICLIVLLTVKLINIRKNKNSSNNVNENVEIKNEIDNNVVNNENELNNEVNNQTESNTNQNTENNTTTKNEPIVDPKQEVDKQTIQKEENNQEKAINIVKKDWGEDNSVYFSFEGIDNSGKYMVCVRDQDTHTLRSYKIDINAGTFTIE